MMKRMKTNPVRTMKTALYACVSAVLMLGFSCSPDDGAPGPQGQQGEPGLPGRDGSANLQVSEWIPIQLDYVLEPPLDYGYMRIEVPDTWEFTENGGIVMMFFRQNTPDSEEFGVVPLPYIAGTLNLSYIFGDLSGYGGSEGFVLVADWPGGNVTELEDGQYAVRYVMIPGASVAEKKARNYSEMSYEEIIEYFDLTQ